MDGLKGFGSVLTLEAEAGRLPRAYRVEGSVEALIKVLLGPPPRAAVVVGEAGVGKTAVVEGFALRVVAGDVPQALKNVSVRVLDLALFMDLAQRAGMKGIQEWLSFYFKSPQVAPGLYPEHDLFIQLMKLKNTLRHLRGEELITHLGLEYYD